MRASSSARLQLVRDWFIARQMECSRGQHLDSVEPGTPTRDIVDRCHVWINDVGTESGPVSYSEDQDMLGSLMRHLLPTPAVLPPRATPIPS